jgi:hypothetical protein
MFHSPEGDCHVQAYRRPDRFPVCRFRICRRTIRVGLGIGLDGGIGTRIRLGRRLHAEKAQESFRIGSRLRSIRRFRRLDEITRRPASLARAYFSRSNAKTRPGSRLAGFLSSCTARREPQAVLNGA